MEAKEHLTVDDCLKLYEEEGMIGLVERVREISFKAGIREVVGWIDNHSGLDSDVWEEWKAQKKKWGIKCLT